MAAVEVRLYEEIPIIPHLRCTLGDIGSAMLSLLNLSYRVIVRIL